MNSLSRGVAARLPVGPPPEAGSRFRILILKPSSLGDVIQALPVLRSLKRHFPQSEIFWWIQTDLAPLLDGDPDLAGLILFDRRRWARPANWLEIWRSIRSMRAIRFDWVIDLQCLARSGAFAWLANGKLLAGLDEPREGARGFYDLAVRRPSFHTHAVDWYLGVLPALGVPVCRDFEWLPSRPEAAASLRRKCAMPSARWIAVQPGARWANKRWPVEFFAETIRRVAAAVDSTRFAILGGAGDTDLGAVLAQAVPDRCLDLTGRLTLPEMIECLRACEMIVTNDTGPMHVAAALGKRVVGLFGPTEPRRTGPYGQLDHVLQAELPCVPCLKSRCSWPRRMECLRLLTPARVVETVTQALARTPNSE